MMVSTKNTSALMLLATTFFWNKVAAFSIRRNQCFACVDIGRSRRVLSKLYSGIPVDDEAMLEEMERLEAMGGDPFFLTPENWSCDDPEIEEKSEIMESSFGLFDASEEDLLSIHRYVTDGKGPTPKSAGQKADVWQGWDGTVDDDAHLGMDD